MAFSFEAKQVSDAFDKAQMRRIECARDFPENPYVKSILVYAHTCCQRLGSNDF